MTYGIGARVQVIGQLYLNRWIRPGEQGIVTAHDLGPDQALYTVLLDEDGKEHKFAPAEIEEMRKE